MLPPPDHVTENDDPSLDSCDGVAPPDGEYDANWVSPNPD